MLRVQRTRCHIPAQGVTGRCDRSVCMDEVVAAAGNVTPALACNVDKVFDMCNRGGEQTDKARELLNIVPSNSHMARPTHCSCGPNTTSALTVTAELTTESPAATGHQPWTLASCEHVGQLLQTGCKGPHTPAHLSPPKTMYRSLGQRRQGQLQFLWGTHRSSSASRASAHSSSSSSSHYGSSGRCADAPRVLNASQRHTRPVARLQEGWKD
jgi:hypothetical protein